MKKQTQQRFQIDFFSVEHTNSLWITSRLFKVCIIHMRIILVKSTWFFLSFSASVQDVFDQSQLTRIQCPELQIQQVCSHFEFSEIDPPAWNPQSLFHVAYVTHLSKQYCLVHKFIQYHTSLTVHYTKLSTFLSSCIPISVRGHLNFAIAEFSSLLILCSTRSFINRRPCRSSSRITFSYAAYEELERYVFQQRRQLFLYEKYRREDRVKH